MLLQMKSDKSTPISPSSGFLWPIWKTLDTSYLQACLHALCTYWACPASSSRLGFVLLKVLGSNLHKSGRESAAKITPYQRASLVWCPWMWSKRVKNTCFISAWLYHWILFFQPIISSQHSGEYDSICIVCCPVFVYYRSAELELLLNYNYCFHLKWSWCGTQSIVGHINGQWTVTKTSKGIYFKLMHTWKFMYVPRAIKIDIWYWWILGLLYRRGYLVYTKICNLSSAMLSNDA